jgi:5-methylcytosine-specific restriction endonuclease McrA
MPSAAPPALRSVPLKRLTKKRRRAERQRRQEERVASGVTPKRKDSDAEYKAWVISDAFLYSYEWRKLRYGVVVRCKGRCEACGAGKEQEIFLHVDRIKPRRKFPELALRLFNLQGLCQPCNHGKGNWDEPEWQPEEVEAASIEEETDRALDESFLNAMAAE